MERKHLVAVAAAVAFSTNIPAADFQDAGPTTMFYISIPLDTGISRKDQQPSFGLQLQGKREYQAIRIDSKVLNFLPAGGLEVKWIVAGVLAAGAVVALGSRPRLSSSNNSSNNSSDSSRAHLSRPPAPSKTHGLLAVSTPRRVAG
jgi:hypothetical protein